MALRAYLKAARSNEFIRHNAIYFSGSMLVAFLNYLYHPVLSRFLSVSEFGEVQTIISISLGIGIVLTVLSTVALNIVANKEHEPEREEALADLQSLGYWLCIAITIVVIVLGGRAARVLQFNSILPFFWLAAILATSVPIAFRKAYLQAHKRFAAVSASGAITAAGRIIFAASLVAFGFGAAGAVAGLVLAQAASALYLAKKTGYVATLRFKPRPSFGAPVRREAIYGLATFLAIGFIIFITSADVVFAKAFFDPEIAGLYSGISTVARIVFFATGSVAGVLVASVKTGSKDNIPIMLRALALLAALGGSILVLFTLFPDIFVRLFLGEKFAGLSPLLPRLSIATFLASLANLLFFYFLAIRKLSLCYAAVGGAAATLVAISWANNTPADIANAFIVGSACSAIMLVFLFILHWKRGDYGTERKSEKNIPDRPGIQRGGEPADLLP